MKINKIKEEHKYREKCYKCYRPLSSCMCKYIKEIETKTKFIILMHPKEFKKTKNTTGHLTNKSLKNSKIFIGIDFTKHKEVNEIINDENNECYVIYPSMNALNLNKEKIKTNKNIVLFLIDSTWSCSKRMLRESENLKKLPKVSFTHTKNSEFKIKQQPNEYCLSTIESTLCIIELLKEHKLEDIKDSSLDSFLEPFKQMVQYQIKSLENNNIRYK